jgi:death on curing protein
MRWSLFGTLDLGINSLPPANTRGFGYPAPDIAALAACYAHGVASKQVFLDGNKRTSSAVTRTFLRLNGYDYARPADKVTRLLIWKRIGDGSLSEPELSDWIRANVVKLPPDLAP